MAAGRPPPALWEIRPARQPGSAKVLTLATRVSEDGLVLGQGELDRVVLVRGRRDMEPMRVLGPVVPAPCQAPGPAGGGLELGEVALPHLVRAGRLLRERGLAALGEPAAFALLLVRQDQTPRSRNRRNTMASDTTCLS